VRLRAVVRGRRDRRGTVRRFADEEIHLWTFDESGRVVRLRHYLDTAKHIATSRGEDTTSR